LHLYTLTWIDRLVTACYDFTPYSYHIKSYSFIHTPAPIGHPIQMKKKGGIQVHITTKELLYISDSMKNESLLAKLCVHGAVECKEQQLVQVLSQIAETRFSSFARMQDKLREKANIAH
jgi:hypothetical protein